MKTLLKTIEEAGHSVAAAGTLSIENFLPSFGQGLRFVQRYCGKTLVDKAITHYNSTEFVDYRTTEIEQIPVNTKLAILIQSAAVAWGFYKYSPIGNVLVNNSGITVTWSEKQRPATDSQLDRMGNAVQELAFEYIDELLELAYADADLKKAANVLYYQNLFLNSKNEFSAVYDIGDSARFFFELVPIIREVQNLWLKPVLKDNFDHLISVHSGNNENVTDLDKQILDLIPTPLALMSMFEASTRLDRELFVNSLYNRVTGTSERNMAQPSQLFEKAKAGFAAIDKLLNQSVTQTETTNRPGKFGITKKGFRA
jgi:hypothetical protein